MENEQRVQLLQIALYMIKRFREGGYPGQAEHVSGFATRIADHSCILDYEEAKHSLINILKFMNDRFYT
jgi:hypothetical protein